ncbi:MAG: M20 family metallopeptidase [Planctomycetota bacterium]|jgi:acetylornithine deacetylase/succinyl-diaminopimelate desuccinylase-like protein
MDSAKAKQLVDQTWDEQITPQLVEYIKIPCKSPAFDADWEKHGYMDQAVEQISGWCKEQAIEGLSVEVVRLAGRTPLIYMEVPGEGDDTVLLYGHLDKQPEMVGWHEDLGPWKPVIKDGKLYGRGGADDGYAAYASLTAIRALREQGGKHSRCVILIEACEESGSYDLPYYIDHLKDRIGSPSLVVCLDSGCGNYDQLWCTNSLRGMAVGNLTVEILEQGVHSGDASGIVPSSFRIVRQLISRIEDEKTGEIIPDEFKGEIPQQRIDQAALSAKVLGENLYERFPFPAGAGPVSTNGPELVLNRTWGSFLAVTGAEGLPALGDAGNVLRPKTAVKLSLRLPPTCDADAATVALKRILEADPPYGAKVTFEAEDGAPGWNAPDISPWLMESINNASQTYFGAEAVHMGEGGSIPFMGMLGEKFPKAQFMITGVLGPQSNAHGPNEFLHLATGKRLTCCVAQVLEDQYKMASS